MPLQCKYIGEENIKRITSILGCQLYTDYTDVYNRDLSLSRYLEVRIILKELGEILDILCIITYKVYY